MIVGKRVQKLKILSDRKVIGLPFVENIKDAYAKADIMVSPIRIGGGTNFKVLEAMTYGIPVVAFPARVKSLGIKDGKHMFLAETPSEYVQKIEALLKDSVLRTNMSKKARQLVEENYSWEKTGDKLNKIWKTI